MTSPADEDIFEALATTTPLRVDPETGAATRLGPDGLYQYVGESPDRAYLLVYRLAAAVLLPGALRLLRPPGRGLDPGW